VRSVRIGVCSEAIHRTLKRSTPNFVAVAVFCCAWTVHAATEVRLATDGKPLLPIVVNENASEFIRSSARTLAEQLGRISHASFVVTNGTGESGIAIGTAKDFPGLKLEAELNAPEPARREQYLLRSHAKGLSMVGVSELGVQHAVWDLLHRLGYRHFFPGKNWEIVPDVKDLRIAVEANEKPDWFYRRIWYGFGPWETAKEAGEKAAFDRGRDGALGCSAPPSEPDRRFSRIRLSSQWGLS
jgi:hypothetical protein